MPTFSPHSLSSTRAPASAPAFRLPPPQPQPPPLSSDPPAPVPHDGPVFHIIRRLRVVDGDGDGENGCRDGGDGGGSGSGVRFGSFSVSCALIVMEVPSVRSSAPPARCDDGGGGGGGDCDGDGAFSPSAPTPASACNSSFYRTTCSELITSLVTGTSGREQLAALRSFRSTVMHVSRSVVAAKAARAEEGSGGERNGQAGEVDKDDPIVVGTFRLLLELSLSCSTSLPMRRAVRSSLDALRPAIVSLETYDEILGAVTDSVLSCGAGGGDGAGGGEGGGKGRGNEGGHMWSDPASALFEALSYHPLSSSILGSPYAVLRAMELLISLGSNDRADLDGHSFFASSSSAAGSDATGEGNEEAEFYSPRVLAAVERGVGIAAALKLLLTPLLGRKLGQLFVLSDEGGGVPSNEGGGGGSGDDEGNGNSADKDANEDTTRNIGEALGDLTASSLIPFLSCRAATGDGLSVVGVSYGQALVLRWRIEAGAGGSGACSDGEREEDSETEAEVLAERAAAELDRLTGTTSPGRGEDEEEEGEAMVWPAASLPDLNRLAALRGLTAALPDALLLRQRLDSSGLPAAATSSASLLSHPVGSHLLLLSRNSADPSVRLSALRGLDSALGRVRSSSLLLDGGSGANTNTDACLLRNESRSLAEQALEVALTTWECPPSRQVGSAVPRLFEGLVGLMRRLDELDHSSKGMWTGTGTSSSPSIDGLVRRVLLQPRQRKGRYIALEALLPVVGARRLLELGGGGGCGGGDGDGDWGGADCGADRHRDGDGESLIPSLVAAVGDGSNNAGSVADLLGKLLGRLRAEMCAEAEINDDADDGNGAGDGAGNKKQRRKREQAAKRAWLRRGRDGGIAEPSSSSTTFSPAAAAAAEPNAVAATEERSGSEQPDDRRRPPLSRLPPGWVRLWAPHFARALLAPSTSSDDDVRIRRTRSADFLLPLIGGGMVCGPGGTPRRYDAGRAYASLLRELGEQAEALERERDGGSDSGGDSEVWCGAAFREERTADVLAWARLEVARHALGQKLLGARSYSASSSSSPLWEAVASEIPPSLLHAALRHESSRIRLSAFLAIEAVAPTYNWGCRRTVVECVREEAGLWEEALPYAIKCGEKEYVNRMMQCLRGLLTRISVAQAEEEEEKREEKGDGEHCPVDTEAAGTDGEGDNDIVVAFACDVLLDDVAIRQGAYPGTVAEKEAFVLPLLRCLLDFACEGDEDDEEDYRPKKKKNPHHRRVGKRGVPKRRLTPSQVASRRVILRRMLSPSTVGTLVFSLLRSPWDRTRASAYGLAVALIRRANAHSESLPPSLASDEGVGALLARGVYLASSPRQRESDTGARMLAVLHSARPDAVGRMDFARKVTVLLEERVDMMEGVLLGAVAPAAGEAGDNLPVGSGDADGGGSEGKRGLPLAHGLFHALQLILENRAINRDVVADEKALFERIVAACCRSIELSLTIVADVKEEEDEGDEEAVDAKLVNAPKKVASAPLNVNTGAIGANACYTTVESASVQDDESRFATQRVVVGAWLLTKEACALLASAISEFPESPSLCLVKRSGSLLISTLTSLKHQGAAFAAHKALQQISLVCMSCKKENAEESLRSLPWMWARQLMHEISSSERVRDSTLRRSTGYALGFLSVMRTEPPAGVTPRTLCPFVLANLIHLSLPPSAMMLDRVRSWNLSGASATAVFVYPSILSSSQSLYPSDETFEWRTRVHALNIIRLAILDAPLAPEMSKFVGDSIISAVMGYDDELWAVRNSATMVFASAMLRVVDSDKNAASRDNDSGGNAITANELFRSYPSLPRFLIATMTELVKKMSRADSLEESDDSTFASHTPLFPILLLLSRLQPISISNVESSSLQVTDSFIAPILKCLGHPQHKVRAMAARALAVVCSGDKDNEISARKNLLGGCMRFLYWNEAGQQRTWNERHGALLGIQSLIMSSPIPEQHFSDRPISSVISYYASWCSGSCKCPPACVAVALQIWAHVQDARGAEIKAGNSTFEETIQEIINAVETLDCTEHINLVGIAELGSIAGKLSVESSFSTIFDPSVEHTELRTWYLAKIEKLLTSPSYDVRTQAVKALKKPLCSKMDALISDDQSDKELRTRVITSVFRMLMRSILTEMQRDDTGAHPPSIRRLSRCALECLAALRCITGHSVPIASEEMTSNLLWQLFSDMWRLGGGKAISTGNAHSSKEGYSAGNALSGNSLELMAFLLSSQFSDKECIDSVEQANLFANATENSTDPLSPWTVRHSAVVAIGSSAILNWKSSSALVQRRQSDLFMVALKFLEDNDADVRRAAGRALAMSRHARGSNTNEKNIALLSVPLVSLESAVHKTNCGPEMMSRLFAVILRECQDLREEVRLALEELSQSEREVSPNTHLNLSTKKKIFENEDPNPFEEKLVTCQVAVAILANWPADQAITDSKNSSVQRILELSTWLLNGMKNRSGIHYVSWANRVFPSFCGIVLGSAAAIYLGFPDKTLATKVQLAASAVLSKEGSGKALNSMHPCLLEALNMLLCSEKRRKETRQGLLKCCFLLPGARGELIGKKLH